MRSWRRPDDEFVYELVVVSSGDEALIAARLNVNLQAVVIRRRFSHRSTRDLSTLAEFVDTKISDELADHQSPDERTEILATSLSKLRPELDLYLMTEIEVEDIAGRLGQHFRRVFHARKASWSCTCPSCRAWRPATAPRSSARSRNTATGRPASSTRCRSPRASRSSTRTGSKTWSASTASTCSWRRRRPPAAGWIRCWSRPARCGMRSSWPPRPTDRGSTYFVTNGTSTANKIVTQSLVAPGDIVLLDRNCHQSHHYGMMLAGAKVIYLEAYPLTAYSMYGAVPLREIKSKLLALKARRQAGPGQDDLADQLHLRRHRL